MSDVEERVEKVLLADDDDDDFELFEEAIRDLNVNVKLSRAENGDILLKLLDADIPDILFLDILMPKCDGRDCLQDIRRQRKFDQLPIIVYTSMSDFDSIEFCYRHGSNFYVLKPASYTELVQVLESIFAVNWKKMLYFPPRDSYVINA